MVSTTTISRAKKEQLLKEIIDDSLYILLLEKRDRDSIHLSRFKKLSDEVKDLKYEADFRNRASEKTTKGSRIQPTMKIKGDHDA